VSTAIYPGSFDPVTLGHLDVIGRSCAVFDRLVVAILENTRKSPSIPAGTRAGIIRDALRDELGGAADQVEVTTFQGLTVELARAVGAGFIVRGLRAVSDFESELQMAHLNRKLAPEVDTVFLMTGLEHAYLSSSLVREIAAFGGDVSGMVPAAVLGHLGSQAQPPQR
jgi:pantetheine-phosphate adenylyltransferase